MNTLWISNWPWTVTLNREMIDVTLGRHSSPNECWRATDSQGHEHRWENGYPTLRRVVDESHWCDGHEGMYNHDPHEQVDESHYECLLCGEVVKPAMDPPGTPKFIPGAVTGTIEGPRSNGLVIRAWLTADEIDAIRSDPENADAMQALVDAIPDERISSTTFASA